MVLGPGSWFTSVLPHLLVPQLARALITTPARRLVALNLAPQPGETEGFSPHAHLEVLADHAPELTIDVVLADRRAADGTDGELRRQLTCSAAGWCWRTWPWGTGRPATTRGGSPARSRRYSRGSEA